MKTYSLGMRQRLGIARCLLADPALLILDEPMNGLDPAGILEMRHLIRAFVDEGRTVFLSSHLLDEVEKTCDQIAIVDRGRVIVQGAVGRSPRRGDPTVLIEVDDLAAARRLLAASRASEIEEEAAQLRVDARRQASAPAEREPRARRGRASPSRGWSPRARRSKRQFLADHLAAGGQRMRLISAEVLKLVRRRGLMIVVPPADDRRRRWSSRSCSSSCTRSTPHITGRRAGRRTSAAQPRLLALLGTLTAILIGATAGSQDVRNGVFRDLVVTGPPALDPLQRPLAGRAPRLAADAR